MKAVMLSIQPKWCELIASEKKTIEVRKTAPKLQTPFKCYIYCTKDMHYELAQIRAEDGWRVKHITDDTTYANGCTWNMGDMLNGKVIGEFVCDRMDKYEWQYWGDVPNADEEYMYFPFGDDESKASCLSFNEINDYGNGKTLYGLHISDLKIYDKPKELGEFKRICNEYGSDNPNCDGCKFFIDGRSYEYDESDCAFAGHPPLTRPPQSWCYVEELSE